MKPKETFSMRALSKLHNIPIAQLKIAKDMKAPGFMDNNSVKWALLEPWLKENTALLTEKANQSYDFYKTDNARKDGILKDLEIQKRRGEMLDPQDVKDFLSRVGLAQASIFKSKLVKELPPKLVGLPLVDLQTQIQKVVQEVCHIFQNEFGKWMD